MKLVYKMSTEKPSVLPEASYEYSSLLFSHQQVKEWIHDPAHSVHRAITVTQLCSTLSNSGRSCGQSQGLIIPKNGLGMGAGVSKKFIPVHSGLGGVHGWLTFTEDAGMIWVEISSLWPEGG